MELVVKPINVGRLDDYINAGADAFCFGLKNYSVGTTSVVTINSLLQIKRKIKDRVKIFIAVDRNMFNKDLKRLEKKLILLDEMGVDGILFYDMAVLSLHKKNHLSVKLFWNQNFMVTNADTCNFYLDQGVGGFVLSSEITRKEIVSIKDKVNGPVMINIFGHQLASFSKRKLISNYFRFRHMLPMKKNYRLKEKKSNDNYYIKEEKYGTAIFSNYVLNGLRYMPYFKRGRVDYVVLNEEFIKHRVFVSVIKRYRYVLDNRIGIKRINDMISRMDNIIPDLSLGFFDKETIYKVKRK